MLEHGRRFALWLRSALDRRGWNAKQLHDKSGVSNSYISVLLNDGLNKDGIYQRPSKAIIQALAGALDASEDDGREAAGHGRRQPRPSGQIVLEDGATYSFVANPYGIDLELEITPELIRELELHSELQKLRRQRGEVLQDPCGANDR